MTMGVADSNKLVLFVGGPLDGQHKLCQGKLTKTQALTSERPYKLVSYTIEGNVARLDKGQK